MYIILIVSLVLFIIPIIVTLVMRHEKKRTKELHEFANRYKFDYSEKGEAGLLKEMEEFRLFSKGGSRKINHVMHTNTREAELTVMEFSYTTHNGKTTHKWTQTVVYFKSDLLSLPSFAMRPENIFHKIGSTFGYQDIDFDTHPEFSKHFLLRGEDEAAIRKLFHSKILHHFNHENGISIEGNKDRLIYYMNAKRIKTENLKSFIDKGIQVFNLFEKKPAL